MAAMKKIALLGSTGSIGVTALRVIESAPMDYRIVALGAGRNMDLLARQIARFRPAAVAVINDEAAEILKGKLDGGHRPGIFVGPEGLVSLALMEEADTLISAMAGAAGLVPTFEAVRAGKTVALANKETMVMAGSLVVKEARNRGKPIIPIDSEHSAILQSLRGHPREDLERVVLTASGGPFKSLSLEDMSQVTPAQALNHPTWKMGSKITIDSATLMNKGLEVIEAKWLFDLRMDQIDILIHPQSIVHSMVEYKDGSVIAQMGIPDMTIPISYALAYPHHRVNILPRLRLEEIASLNFFKPDLDRFKCLRLSMEAAGRENSLPAVLNGANEIAVEAFLGGRIGFLDIPEIIEKTMEAHEPFPIADIASVLKADAWARRKAGELIELLVSKKGDDPGAPKKASRFLGSTPKSRNRQKG